jgi:hypothetical protein
MLGAVLLTLYLPRTLVNAGIVGALVVGSCVMALGAHIEDGVTTLVGELMVVMLHYSMAQNVMMIAL